MKYFFSFIMILFILSSQLSELIVYISFKVNQDYIAKNLCVEKDVEGSTCMGCCQLKKRMNEQQERKKEIPALQNSKQDFIFNISSDNLPFFVKGFRFIQKRYFEHYKFIFSHFIFRPPQLLS